MITERVAFSSVMLMILGGVYLLVGAAVFGTGGPICAAETEVQAPLRLDSPLDYQVFQRRTRREGNVHVSGRTPAGTEQVEVQLGGDWLPVAFSKTNGTFDAEVKAAPGGWYACRVRATAAGQPLAAVEVPHVGVGEVFVVAGQSNSANHGEEKQRTQTGLVAAFDGNRWQLAHDPQPGASGGGGSLLPPLGDALAQRFKVPVGLVACGIGATSVREWLPKGARFPHPPTLLGRVQQLPSGQWESRGDAFAMFTARMKQLGPHGFRAVLWHQGESDANQKDPTRTLPGDLYRQYLAQVIRDSRREIGWEAPWFVAQVSYHVPGDEASPDIRAAQASLWKDGIALEGPDSDALKGKLRERDGQGVHFSGPGLREHAARWAEKVTPWLEAQLAGGGSRFVPDFKIKPDDYTVLMAADGQNPGGLHAWINDHRRMQVKNWPLGGQTTWEVEVVEAGDYAVSVLFNHSVRSSLKVAVMAGAARCEGVSEHVAHHDWRRFSLPGAMRLAPGRQSLALGIAPVSGESLEKLELLAIELVRPEVQERLHRAALAMRAQADTQWFRDTRYGLMCHWTSQTVPRHGPPKAYAEAVRAFDVQTFAEQVEQTGARFVSITTSHAMMYFPAPLKSLDRILPGRTTQRDLVGELAEALGQRGIRLMLYYHLGSDADRAWQEASGFWKTDTAEFWNNWAAVIGEAGERYGEKLAGWWFDDGTANYYYRSAPWERLAKAAKAGNPKRLICFNPWILPSATEFQDYLAGEGNSDPAVQGWLKPGDRGRISGGAYAGLQASAALIMEGDWLHTKLDTDIGAPRQSAAQLTELLRRFAALENVPMLNCEIYQEGTLSPATVELLHVAHQAIRTDALPGGK